MNDLFGPTNSRNETGSIDLRGPLSSQIFIQPLDTLVTKDGWCQTLNHMTSPSEAWELATLLRHGGGRCVGGGEVKHTRFKTFMFDFIFGSILWA